MTEEKRAESDRTEKLLDDYQNGDRRVVDELLGEHRARLRRMIELRITPQLRGRIDASDVIQEAFLEASQRLPKYVAERAAGDGSAGGRRMPFFIWLRFITRQKLNALYRHHAGTLQRDARREVPLESPAPGVTSEVLAAELVGRVSSPSQAVVRVEKETQLQSALNALEPSECEILALRHHEQLSNAEAAIELGIEAPAASKRYIRALIRLRAILDQCDLSFTGFQGDAQ